MGEPSCVWTHCINFEYFRGDWSSTLWRISNTNFRHESSPPHTGTCSKQLLWQLFSDDRVIDPYIPLQGHLGHQTSKPVNFAVHLSKKLIVQLDVLWSWNMGFTCMYVYFDILKETFQHRYTKWWTVNWTGNDMTILCEILNDVNRGNT